MARTNCDHCEFMHDKTYGKWEAQVSQSPFRGKDPSPSHVFIVDVAGDYLRGDCCRVFPHQLVCRNKNDAFCYSGKLVANEKG